jgi:hypothetical protein
MRTLASYILKGPVQALLSAAVPAAVSVSAPFLLKLLLIYFSGIAIALVSLRLGARKGLSVLAAAAIAALLAGQLLQISELARLDLWNSLYLWALLWLAASVLQASRSLTLALETIGLVAIVTIVLFFLLVEEPVQMAMQLLEPMGRLLRDPASGLSSQDVTDMMLSAATLLAGSIVAYTAFGAVICLLIARAWQARLYNPGGLQLEFRALRLGRKVGLFTIVMIGGLIFSRHLGEPLDLILMNAGIVTGLLYIIVGLGVVHGLMAQRDNAAFWLVGLYALLIILSHVVAPMLMTLALTDIWVDYRARFAKKLS